MSGGRRRRRPGRGALAVLAIVVFAASTVSVLAPRLLSAITTNELRAALGDVAPERRDPQAALTVAEPFGPGETGATSRFAPPEAAVYGALEQALESVRTSLREPLRDALQPAEFVALSGEVTVVPPTAEPDDPIFLLRTALDPLLDDRVRIVEGRLAMPRAESDGLLTVTPVELIVSRETAEALRWSVGEQRVVQSGLPYVLVGIFEAVDPKAAYWARVMSVLEPERFDDGNTRPRVIGTAYLNPVTVEVMVPRTVLAWYPLAVDSVGAAEIDQLAPQLRQLTAAPIALPLVGPEGTTALFASDAITVIDGVLGRSAVTTAVLAMVASGPAGVLVTVLSLAALTVVERRRPTLAIMVARGASSRRLRGGSALSGLAVGILAAGAGMVTAIAVVPAPVTITDIATALVFALMPAVLLAALVDTRGLRTPRDDLGIPSRRRALWRVGEVVIVAVAGGSVFLTVHRGVTTSATSVGVDPLLVVMPVVSTVAVCVVAMRAYPAVMMVVRRWARDHGSADAMIGATRSVRDRAGTLTTVLAMAVAVSVTVFSVGLLTSLDRAIAQSARDTVGADVRVNGFGFASAAAVDALAEEALSIDGVSAVAVIADAGPVVVTVGDERRTATLWAVDERIVPLRTDVPAGWPSSPPALDANVQVVVSADVVDGLEGEVLVVGPQQVDVVAVGRADTGYSASGSWVLVSRADAQRLTSRSAESSVVVLDIVAGADREGVVRSLDAVAPSTARVSTVDAAEADLRQVPTTAALRDALLAVVGMVVALTFTALALTVAIGAPARRRVSAIMRVLGSRPTSALVVWQLAPPAIVAALVGLVWGWALLQIVLSALDLRAFTDSQLWVSASVDPVVVAALLASLAGGVAVTVASASRAERTIDLTRTLRTESS